jgi:hypothetical protein
MAMPLKKLSLKKSFHFPEKSILGSKLLPGVVIGSPVSCGSFLGWLTFAGARKRPGKPGNFSASF